MKNSKGSIVKLLKEKYEDTFEMHLSFDWRSDLLVFSLKREWLCQLVSSVSVFYCGGFFQDLD